MIYKRGCAVRTAIILIFASIISMMARGRPVWATATIDKVGIRVASQLEAGDSRNETISIDDKDGLVSVSVSSDKYEITDAKWASTAGGSLAVGDEPKMVVTLTPTDEWEDYFKSAYEKKDVSISNGEYVSARKNGADLIVTLKIKAIKGTFPQPEEAYWNEITLGKAQWDLEKNSGGASEVWLYRGKKVVHKAEGVTAKTLNLYPYMTEEGVYTFKVRLSPHSDQEKKGGKSSEWTESGELVIHASQVSDGSQQIGKNEATLQKGDPSNTGKGWYRQDGIWHYRDNDGYDVRGEWLELGESWYLFRADGAMVTGWHQMNDGTWYYMNADGAMVTGWQKIDGKTYYFNPSWSERPIGAAFTGWNIIDGYTYYFNEDASMHKGWLYQINSWYYLNELEGSLEGAMLKGWIYRNGLYYYTNEYGVMQTGWQEIDGYWYYLDPSDGHKAVNTLVNGFYVDEDGIWREGV